MSLLIFVHAHNAPFCPMAESFFKTRRSVVVSDIHGNIDFTALFFMTSYETDEQDVPQKK